jgi:integrase
LSSRFVLHVSEPDPLGKISLAEDDHKEAPARCERRGHGTEWVDSMHDNRKAATGHLTVEERAKGRVWIAKHNNTPDGKTTRKTLGPAWVKRSTRETARGAVVWRAADGSKPDGYLTPEDARTALAELLRAPVMGRALRSPTHTFGEACAMFLERAERDREPSTFRGYRTYVRAHLIPRIGERTPLQSITTATVDKIREDLLNAGKAPRTVQQIMVILNGVLVLAVKRGLIESNPSQHADKVKVTASGDFNFLEPEQVEAIARQAGEHAALIRVAAYTGLRMGELRALRWIDVEFAHAIVRVRRNAPTSAPVGAGEKAPKSSKVRSVPMIAQAATALDGLSRRELFTGADDRVFPSLLGGPFDDAAVRDSFYAALSAAGLGHMREKDNPITFHDLRHVFGSLAVRVAPLTDVKAWMGHADIATTMIYVHSIPQHDAAAKLSAAFAIESSAAAVEPIGSISAAV